MIFIVNFFLFLDDLMWLLQCTVFISIYHQSLLIVISFVVFYQICIWSARFHIYFMTFVMQQINTIKDKIITSNWCFQPHLISRKFFDNVIYFMINHDFYVNTCWIHYAVFIIVCRRYKVNWYSYWIFAVSNFLTLFVMPFKFG